MFDIGFSEIVVIGAVALVVFGPEELPRVARTAGHLLGKMRRYVTDVKADIAREMELADLKRIQEEVAASARGVQEAIQEQTDALREEVNQAVAPINEEIQALETQLTPERAEPVPVEPAAALSLAQEGSEAVAAEPSPQAELALGETAPAATAAEPEEDDGQLDLFGDALPRPSGELAQPAAALAPVQDSTQEVKS